MAPHPIPIPCDLALQPTRHRDPPQPSPCWALHLMTQERLMSHPVRAAPRSHRNGQRRHAVGSHSALALRLYLAACNPSSNCRFWDLDHLCSNWSQSFILAESRKPDLWTYVFAFSFSAFSFLIEIDYCFEFLFAICSLSPQRHEHYFNLDIVPWQYQKYWTILLFVLCLLHVEDLRGSSKDVQRVIRHFSSVA